jgi:hypothetical protein
MNDKRRYQRYTIENDIDAIAQGEVIVGGELVQLVDFSLSGLCVLSKIPFSSDVVVNISVDFEDRGEIDSVDKITRVKQEGNGWRIAIDLA